MKTTLMTIIAGLALTATTQAGESHSAKGGKEIIPPPQSCLWTWFAGGSVGKIDGNWDESIYTLHAGVERKCPGQSYTHAFFLEVGLTDNKDVTRNVFVVDFPTVSNELDIKIIPITLNYKYERMLSGKLNGYIGAGAGIALVDLDVNSSVGVKLKNNDTVFYGHIFAGLVYNVSESFEIFAGVRYIFMDDPSLTGIALFDNEAELDADLHYEIGGRFNF